MMTDTPSAPPSDNDLVKRLEERHETARVQGGDMMTYGEGDPLALSAAAEITRLRAELAEAKRELKRAHTAEKTMESDAAIHRARAEQAEAARDRFAAVIASEGVGKWRNEAIAHFRAKQEKENRS